MTEQENRIFMAMEQKRAEGFTITWVGYDKRGEIVDEKFRERILNILRRGTNKRNRFL